MPKINKEEYEVLKELDDKWKWKWITRIEEGAMKTFISKPFKNMDFGRSGSWDIKGNEDHAIYTTYSDLFQFIQWEDEEPHNIAELIREYEGEKTEVKNIEWLKAQICIEMMYLDHIRKERWSGVKYQTLRSVSQKINQLDEPEVLSQELPVIPKYVAEYIDLVKIDIPLMKILEVANRRNELPEWKKEYDWISANDETFARAWLDGFTVEEEQKYYAKLKEIRPLEGEWLTNLSGPNYYVLDTKGLMLGEFILDLIGMKKEASTHTLKDWERYGINHSNADFVKVDE